MRYQLFKPISFVSRLLSRPSPLYFKQNTQLARALSFVKPHYAINQSFSSNITLKSSFNPRFDYKNLLSSTKWNYSSMKLAFKRSSKNGYNPGRHYKYIRWNKLIRPAVFTVAFCLSTTFLIPPLLNYTPLAIFKKYPDSLIYTIIAINGAVFLAWRSPQFYRVLNKYFLIVKENLNSDWSMVGAAFSHQSFGHLLVNMFVLQSFGTTLCGIVGASNFLVAYLNSAVIASFFSILIPTVMRSSLSVASLGASGAIFSVFGIFSYLIPKAPIALFFIPIPGGAWFIFLGTLAYNVAGAAFRWGTHDFAAHIGGCIAGIAYGWYFTKISGWIQRRRKRSVYF